jgi:hypothetical protein
MSIDFNSAAPAAARAAMFQARKGEPAPNNAHGWLVSLSAQNQPPRGA